MRISIALLLSALFACQSHAQVSQDERAALIDLYHATDGDDWIENEGWLGEEGTECSWFGIHCLTATVDGVTEHRLSTIGLDGNNLHGELPDVVSRLPHLTTLDLSDNALTGPIPPEYIEPPESLTRTGWSLVLAHNLLTGTLPDVAGESSTDMQVTLFLRGNRLTGALPPSWAGLTGTAILVLDSNDFSGELPPEWASMSALDWLDLSENNLSGTLPEWLAQRNLSRLNLRSNQIEGSIEHAVSGFDAQPSPVRFTPVFDLSDNRFSGVVPDALMEFTGFAPANGDASGFPGLNLCGNDLEVVGEDMLEFLKSHNMGGDVTGCLGRERAPFELTASGTWYDPARSGEGFIQQVLGNGDLVVYWFTFPANLGTLFDPQLPPSERGPWQMWAFQTPAVGDSGFATHGFHRPRGGSFGAGGADQPDYSVGAGDTPRAGIFRVAPERMHAGADISEPVSGSNLDYKNFSHRNDLVQLTRLAGTTCDNQQPNQWVSGLWYDPERSGEGFIVEVIEDGRGVVYWFTYTVPSSFSGVTYQAWMTGDGEFDGTTLHIDNLIQPVGTNFGPDFDRDDVDRAHWGTLTMEFHGDDSGHVHWDSVFEDYGTGDYPLRRLARAGLAECADD